MESPVTEHDADLSAWLETYTPFGMRLLTVSPVWNRGSSGLFSCGISGSHKDPSATFVDGVTVSLVPGQLDWANDHLIKTEILLVLNVPVSQSTHRFMNKLSDVKNFCLFLELRYKELRERWFAQLR
jgi:hypothetical protein